MDERISLRFNGKLLTLRMEDANLENIDRVAKAKDMSRSEWMRMAMLTQLVVDLAEIGAPEPDPAPEFVDPAFIDEIHEAREAQPEVAPEPEPAVARSNRWN